MALRLDWSTSLLVTALLEYHEDRVVYASPDHCRTLSLLHADLSNDPFLCFQLCFSPFQMEYSPSSTITRIDSVTDISHRFMAGANTWQAPHMARMMICVSIFEVTADIHTAGNTDLEGRNLNHFHAVTCKISRLNDCDLVD